MIPKTFFTRLQTLLKGLVWTGTSSLIFGENVFIIPSLNPATFADIVHPTCYVLEGGYKCHDEHPNILFQNFQILFFVENVQSRFGETALLSGNRTTGTSQGAGLFEIEQEILTNVIKTFTLTDAVFIVEEGAGKSQILSSNFPLLNRSLSFSVMLSMF